MHANDLDTIVANLPYGEGFKYVHKLLEIQEDRVIGVYRFRESEPFYNHHFKQHPITPGVILIECMAQIGLACLGSYLNRDNPDKQAFVFTESHVLFTGVVKPETTVIVSALKEYYRFGKLKVTVKMVDENDQKIAQGWLSGMMVL